MIDHPVLQVRMIRRLLCAKTYKRLLTSRPDDEQGQRYLTATLENLASATSLQSPADARTFHQQAIEIQHRLTQSHPLRQDLQQQLAVSYDSFGLLLTSISEQTEAEVAFLKAADIQRQLLRTSPTSTVLLRQLAWSNNHRGQTLARIGRVVDATAVLRESLHTQQQACNLSGDEVRDLSALGGIWNNLGYVLEGQQDTASAIEAYRAAVEQLTAAVNDKTATDRDRDALQRARMNLDRILRRQTDTQETRDVAIVAPRDEPGSSPPQTMSLDRSEDSLMNNAFRPDNGGAYSLRTYAQLITRSDDGYFGA